MTLPTKNGGWAIPEEMVFPVEYSPNYDIEKMISKILLKVRIPEFVSPELFLPETDKKSQWQEFLVKKLSCSNDESLKKIEEEVGVECVKPLEGRNGCIIEDPRALGLNENPGYDLKLIDKQGNIKLVEVKSGKDKHGFNFTLSKNEHRALSANKGPNTKN